MGRRQQWVYAVEPAGWPADFPERLMRFKDAAGVSWRGLARMQRVNARTVRRWRAGTIPSSGHLLSLLESAARLDLLHLLMPVGSEIVSTSCEVQRRGNTDVDRSRPTRVHTGPSGPIFSTRSRRETSMETSTPAPSISRRAIRRKVD